MATVSNANCIFSKQTDTRLYVRSCRHTCFTCTNLFSVETVHQCSHTEHHGNRLDIPEFHWKFVCSFKFIPNFVLILSSVSSLLFYTVCGTTLEYVCLMHQKFNLSATHHWRSRLLSERKFCTVVCRIDISDNHLYQTFISCILLW